MEWVRLTRRNTGGGQCRPEWRGQVYCADPKAGVDCFIAEGEDWHRCTDELNSILYIAIEQNTIDKIQVQFAYKGRSVVKWRIIPDAVEQDKKLSLPAYLHLELFGAF